MRLGHAQHVVRCAAPPEYPPCASSLTIFVCVSVSVCMIHRVSEGSTLCPEWKHLHVPTHAESFNSQGSPKYLSIDYFQWKARPANEVGIAHKQYLHGNPREPDYCAVTAIMEWYLCQHVVAGENIDLRQGPIFGNFNAQTPKGREGYLKDAVFQQTVKMGSGTNKCKVWYGNRELREGRVEDSENETDYVYSERVNFTEDALRNLLYAIFDAAAEVAVSRQKFESEVRLRAATCHTLRASCVAWAARSKSSNAYIEAQLAGRWVETSKVFRIYWAQGKKVSEEIYGRRDDPIYTFKPWPVGGTTRRADSDAIVSGTARLYQGANGLWQGGAAGGERVRPRGVPSEAEQRRREAAAQRLQQ